VCAGGLGAGGAAAIDTRPAYIAVLLPRRSVIRPGAGWREAGTELSSGGSPSALRHTRLDISLLWLNDTLLNVGIALWVIRAVSNVSRGPSVFSSAQLRGVVALQVRISRGSETVVASAGCFSRRHRAGGLLRFVASAEAASPLLAIVALIAGVTTLTIGEMCTLGGRVRIRRRAGAFASTWAIPDAAQHGPRAATNGGSCARHRCRRPRRAGRLAGSRSASASSHWAQQPTSWRAKPMKLACTHRVRHEEQRFTAL
jgi:hypothetical protein